MYTHTESRLAELLEQLQTQLCEHASFDVSRHPSYRALKIQGKSCNEVETGGHGMMGWGPAASTLKDMPVQTQHARF